MSTRRRGIARDPLFDGEFLEAHAGDLGLCAHGLPEDDDCVECRTNRCCGGGECECDRKDAERFERDANRELFL